jgi:hypothetical protein
MKNHKFNSNYESEYAIASARNNLTFDDMQSIFHNWMSRFIWALRQLSPDSPCFHSPDFHADLTSRPFLHYGQLTMFLL